MKKCHKSALERVYVQQGSEISHSHMRLLYYKGKVESWSTTELLPYLYFAIFLAVFWMKSQPDRSSVVVNQWERSVHTH